MMRKLLDPNTRLAADAAREVSPKAELPWDFSGEAVVAFELPSCAEFLESGGSPNGPPLV